MQKTGGLASDSHSSPLSLQILWLTVMPDPVALSLLACTQPPIYIITDILGASWPFMAVLYIVKATACTLCSCFQHHNLHLLFSLIVILVLKYLD